jgi:hypothetical protein
VTVALAHPAVPPLRAKFWCAAAERYDCLVVLPSSPGLKKGATFFKGIKPEVRKELWENGYAFIRSVLSEADREWFKVWEAEGKGKEDISNNSDRSKKEGHFRSMADVGNLGVALAMLKPVRPRA